MKFVKKDDHIALAYWIGGNVAELNLETLPLENWPQEPNIQVPSILLDQDFKPALKAALDCASGDDSRRIITGACMDVSDPAAHYVVGTDGRHLYSANSFRFNLLQSVIIPNSRFINWAGFMDDGGWSLSADHAKDIGWLKLQSARWTFTTRQITGAYPKWRQVMLSMSDMETFVTFDDEAVRMLLEVLPKLPGNDELNTPVTFSIVENRLIVMARHKGMKDSTKITVPGITIQGPPVTITVNRNFVLKALKLGLTQLGMQDWSAPMLFVSEGRKMVIMPLRDQDSSDTEPTPQAAPETPEAPEAPPAINKEEQSKHQPIEERKPVTVNEMPRETAGLEAPVTTRVNNIEPPKDDKLPTMKAAMQQIDQVKEALRDAVVCLNEVVKTLVQVQREHRTAEKEVDSIRDSLRSLQKVKL